MPVWQQILWGLGSVGFTLVLCVLALAMFGESDELFRRLSRRWEDRSRWKSHRRDVRESRWLWDDSEERRDGQWGERWEARKERREEYRRARAEWREERRRARRNLREAQREARWNERYGQRSEKR